MATISESEAAARLEVNRQTLAYWRKGEILNPALLAEDTRPRRPKRGHNTLPILYNEEVVERVKNREAELFNVSEAELADGIDLEPPD